MRASLRLPPQEGGARGRRELTPERSAQLAAVKLRGLVGQHVNREVPAAVALANGAALGDGDAGWVYTPGAPPGSLGVAVMWARANGLDTVNLIVDDEGTAFGSSAAAFGSSAAAFGSSAAAFAYAADAFADPAPRIWLAVGRAIHPVTAESPEIPVPDPCPDLRELLVEAGVDVVADHGVWLGEINGLEVARVGRRGDSCALDIGVGANDQFAAAALAHGRPDREALAAVVDLVRPHRHPDSAPHAIGRLVRSRWLRAQAVADPGSIGLDALRPTPLLIPRPGLTESQPAAGRGRREAAEVVAVFSVGIDPGISETAAGLVHLHQPDELVLVVPPRDRHSRIDAMVEAIDVSSSVVELMGEWAD